MPNTNVLRTVNLKWSERLGVFTLSLWLLSFAFSQTHTVVPGDTLAALAARYDVSVSNLMQLNNLSTTVIRVGQTLQLPSVGVPGFPPSFRGHTVTAGETWRGIATRYDLDIATLEAVNPNLTPGASLLPGGTLIIPPQRGVLTTLDVGQNLLGLALEYGLSPRELIRLNGFTDASSLVAGQRVFLPARALTSTGLTSAPNEELSTSTPASTTERRAQLQAQSVQLVSRAPQLLRFYEPPAQNYIWPLARKGRISSRFGRRNISVRGNTFHAGVDIAAPPGTPILAVQDGVVTRSGWGGSYGYVVYVEHPNGAQTRYAHMRRIAVRSGQRVQQGDVLGEVGSTGASTGPHLHFELRFNGYAADPLGYLER